MVHLSLFTALICSDIVIMVLVLLVMGTALCLLGIMVLVVLLVMGTALCLPGIMVLVVLLVMETALCQPGIMVLVVLLVMETVCPGICRAVSQKGQTADGRAGEWRGGSAAPRPPPMSPSEGECPGISGMYAHTHKKAVFVVLRNDRAWLSFV